MDVTIAGTPLAEPLGTDEWSRVNIELAAFDGEVGTGQFPIPDPGGAASVPSGRQLMVEEGTTLISDGFIIDQDWRRGSLASVGDQREYNHSIMDANALLGGFRVARTRPSETDFARVMAFAALDGPAWDTTWVLNAATVTMPTKEYDGDGGWSELITDLVEFTGKTLFLHDLAAGGRCLHYHLLTNGHGCGLAISDVLADLNATTFAPIGAMRQRTSVDLVNDVMGRDQDGRTSIATDGTSITTHDADGLRHQALVDFEASSQTDLDQKTDAYLASQKDERDTYTCAIGPLTETELALIRVGDLMPITSAAMGMSASTQRIAHMALSVLGGVPGQWLARLELGAPVRRKARIKASLVGLLDPTTPPPAVLPFDPAGDLAIAVGGNAEIATSPDGVTWTLRTTGVATRTYQSVAWSPTLRVFVAVGGVIGDDIIATSPDGVTWTDHTSGFTASISDVCWSPERSIFVAVGSFGELATSPDGVTWTQRTSSFSTGGADGIEGVCWSPALGLFVAVGTAFSVSSAEIATSPDGVTWTLRTDTFGANFIHDVAWSPGLSLFLAVGGGGRGSTSADGINWNTLQTIDAPGDGLNGVAWSPALGLFVVVGGTAKLYTSPDGVTWTSRTSGFSTTTIEDVVWAGSYFIAGGQSGKLTTSIDGVTWTARTSGFGSDIIRGVAFRPQAPVRGQRIQEVVGIGNGSRVIFATTFPYLPGSLSVNANGLPEYDIVETSPSTGLFTFGTAAFTPETVRAEYQSQ